MRTVTAVDAEWLAELGPMFFSIKESFETRMKKKRAQAAEKKLMEEEFKEKKSEVRAWGGGGEAGWRGGHRTVLLLVPPFIYSSTCVCVLCERVNVCCV